MTIRQDPDSYAGRSKELHSVSYYQAYLAGDTSLEAQTLFTLLIDVDVVGPELREVCHRSHEYLVGKGLIED